MNLLNEYNANNEKVKEINIVIYFIKAFLLKENLINLSWDLNCKNLSGIPELTEMELPIDNKKMIIINEAKSNNGIFLRSSKEKFITFWNESRLKGNIGR